MQKNRTTMSRGIDDVSHGTHSADGGKQSSAQMGSGRQHNANSVTKTLGLGGGGGA